eukprot:CAMPEP_0119398570 /NCGR_PEP_ID=MMETSP1334-20130426/140909_1 /TAXON_ID=127549 /ORGANISM="Calcidiscus leptoporus, Strain RCC1130" /LENGTH=743 /DNA_ID=CAMNT_0007422437 /DNA_START=11 /DNA_END=2242 /DNA_ORIENTATION=+
MASSKRGRSIAYLQPKLFTVATCSLNQWALDFEGNLRRISQSISQAKARGARYRCGPELEVPGYGCEDHFYEDDTQLHCWQSVRALLDGPLTDDILCDVGMPVMHRNVRYNCRVFLLNRRVVLIRPKLCLCDDGNYREGRWFTEWNEARGVELFALPRMIGAITGQTDVPFGAAALSMADTVIGAETCEELFTPHSPHIGMSLDGVEIIANGSGSHHQLRKLDKRLELLKGATAKGGGLYLYANQRGCDGGRLYYDGCALIVLNGQVLAQGAQFGLSDVEVLTATVDMEAVRSYRAAFIARSKQAARAPCYPRVDARTFAVSSSILSRPEEPRADADAADAATIKRRKLAHCAPFQVPSSAQPARLHLAEEEIALGPASYLWDYLRRSSAGGFFLPLSGGADSSSTAALVGIMCQQVVTAVAAGDEQVLADARRITRQPVDWIPSDAKELCGLILHTSFMGTAQSSSQTRDRAAKLAAQLGAYHAPAVIDPMISGVLAVFRAVTNKEPAFQQHGGSIAEDLALQNIQARSRMVLSYMLAQLLPWVRGRDGFLLVLGSANVDEALRGYMTKYDCSSADINPIGGISKGDLKRFLRYAADKYGYSVLREVVEAPPTAELRPLSGDEVEQTDEEDMGMTYDELGEFGRLRKMERCGPVSMFTQLLGTWGARLAPAEIARKVKHFFSSYGRNRHKLTTLTPAYHAEGYSPDDNRFDLRQFLYPNWERQFGTMDALAEQIEHGDAPCE